MTAIRFNPLTYCNKLVDSGLTQKSAEAIAGEQADLVYNLMNGKLVTNKYLHQELKSLELKLLIKLGTLMTVLIGVLGFILKY